MRRRLASPDPSLPAAAVELGDEVARAGSAGLTLSETEAKLWRRAQDGALLDLRVGDLERDCPDRAADWGPERTVRAEVLYHMLVGDRTPSLSIALRRIRLQGARISGRLDLEAATLRCPLALLGCFFEEMPVFDDATAPAVLFNGSHLPGLAARQLKTRGDLALAKCTVPGELLLQGAHIGGQLSLSGASLSSENGRALSADELAVDQGMSCGEGFAARGEVRLPGARIGGLLSFKGASLRNENGSALFAGGLVVDGGVFFDEGFTVRGEVSLAGAHFRGQFICNGANLTNENGRALVADRLAVDGEMFCDEGFTARGEVRLPGAHIGSVLSCRGGAFTNENGPALSADGLVVDRDMVCDAGFSARGEVGLVGAHIGGQLRFGGGATLTNENGPALAADRLVVLGGMVCNEGFTARGEVRLRRAHIGAYLSFKGANLACDNGRALVADRLAVDGEMFCDEGFTARGEVRLPGAHIGSVLSFRGANFINENGPALYADGLAVDGGMFCDKGFTARGAVSLRGARLGRELNYREADLTNEKGPAIDLQGAVVSGRLAMQPAGIIGFVDLTAASVGAYRDDPRSWTSAFRLEGFSYGSIQATPMESVRERLAWLALAESGFSPQPYEQLAAVYRRHGRDDDARRVAIAKQRARRHYQAPVGKAWNVFLEWTVGYGYRTWQAGVWLLGLLVVATAVFHFAYLDHQFTAAATSEVPPQFHAFLYAVDVLLPVVNLGQREAWAPLGAVQWIAAGFTVMGWILGTAAVLSLTGLLKRSE